MGMIAIGVGGLDAATVMAGSPFELSMPKVVLDKTHGQTKQAVGHGNGRDPGNPEKAHR